MDEDEKQVGKDVLTDTLGNLAFAVALSVSVPWVLRILGVSEDSLQSVNMILFFTIIFADPVGAWRGSQTLKIFGIKIASGCIVGAMIMATLNLAGLEDTAATVEPGEDALASDADAPGRSWVMFLPILILPLAMMGPVIERILKGTGPDGAPLTKDDLLIGMTFPIYLCAWLGLNIAVAGALWVIGAPLGVGLLVLTAGVLAAVAEAWLAAPDEMLDDMDSKGEWGPRAEDASAAFSGLWMALRTSMSSALFMGGMTYVSIKTSSLVYPAQEGSFDGAGLGILLDLGAVAGIVLVAFLALLLFGLILAASLSFLLARKNGLDPFAMETLAKQSITRLFMGGMQYVRPDIDADDGPT